MAKQLLVILAALSEAGTVLDHTNTGIVSLNPSRGMKFSF